MQDFKYNSNFDIEIYRDIKIASTLESDIQNLQLRLTGTNDDMSFHPEMFSSFEDFVGYDNTKETGELIKEQAKKSILGDNVFSSQSVELEVYPTDYDKMNVQVKYTVPDIGNAESIYVERVVSL